MSPAVAEVRVNPPVLPLLPAKRRLRSAAPLLLLKSPAISAFAATVASKPLAPLGSEVAVRNMLDAVSLARKGLRGRVPPSL